MCVHAHIYTHVHTHTHGGETLNIKLHDILQNTISVVFPFTPFSPVNSQLTLAGEQAFSQISQASDCLLLLCMFSDM